MAQEQRGKRRADWIRQMAVALDLPFLMIGAVMGGGLIGYVLDGWLHTTPWLMLILGGLGFVAGLREVLRALTQRGGGPPERRPGGGQEGGPSE